MNVGILGGGLSALSLAYELQSSDRIDRIEIFEKNQRPGGLCCSYSFAGVECDVGPHIMFSKNAKVLDFMVGLLGSNVHKLRRSAKIYHDGRFIKYPFENDLFSLASAERDYCLNTFLKNPYEGYKPQNMLQFFLATFGEGITSLYLRPYNEKIWKFDPSCMDTQMVARVPKPPAEDIIKGAQGVPVEGHLHQLYFYYPKRGGVEALIGGFLGALTEKVRIHCGIEVRQVTKRKDVWNVEMSNTETWEFDRLVSTIPVTELVQRLTPKAPNEALKAANELKFNSIALCLIHVSRDNLGDSLGIMLPDPAILFHRLTKLDCLTPEEARDSTTRLMAEVTYRQGDVISRMTDSELLSRVIKDLSKLGFIDDPKTVLSQDLFRQRHAYVIYDLHHQMNMQTLRQYCETELGLVLHGRFGEFEYMNMDGAIERSIKCARAIEQSIG
jgi:protoporphyrinogen oxidase